MHTLQTMTTDDDRQTTRCARDLTSLSRPKKRIDLLRTVEKYELENFAARSSDSAQIFCSFGSKKTAAQLGSNILRLSFCGFGCQVTFNQWPSIGHPLQGQWFPFHITKRMAITWPYLSPFSKYGQFFVENSRNVFTPSIQPGVWKCSPCTRCRHIDRWNFACLGLWH